MSVSREKRYCEKIKRAITNLAVAKLRLYLWLVGNFQMLMPTQSTSEQPCQELSHQGEIDKILGFLNVPSSPNPALYRPLDLFDKWSLGGAVGSCILGVFCAYLTHITCISNWAIVSCHRLISLGKFIFFLFAIKQAIALRKNFFRPTKELLDARTLAISNDARIWDSIQKFDPADLEFVGRRLELEATQARKRIALFSPELEKLGIIIISTTTILAISNFAEALPKTSWRLPAHIFLYICVAVFLMNLIGLIVLPGTDRFDQLGQLLNFVAVTKRGKAVDDDWETNKKD